MTEPPDYYGDLPQYYEAWKKIENLNASTYLECLQYEIEMSKPITFCQNHTRQVTKTWISSQINLIRKSYPENWRKITFQEADRTIDSFSLDLLVQEIVNIKESLGISI